MSNSSTWSTADIDLVVRLWNEDGLSGARIAERFGCSRSSIMGLVNRNKDRFVRRSGLGQANRPKPSPVPRLHPGNIASKREARKSDPGCAPAAVAVDAKTYDAQSRRLPLPALEWRDCKFPVNDAAPGETHLFCGAPATGTTSWCSHHLARVVGNGTMGERRADRELLHEAKRRAA